MRTPLPTSQIAEDDDPILKYLVDANESMAPIAEDDENR
jgi:hypothetical protein